MCLSGNCVKYSLYNWRSMGRKNTVPLPLPGYNFNRNTLLMVIVAVSRVIRILY